MTSGLSRPLWRKVVKTIFLVLVWISIGLCLEITGPTQKDLILKLDSNYEDVSRAISGRSLGFFVGAVIGGFLVDNLPLYLDLIIAVCVDGMAGCMAGAPYSPDVNVFWALSFVAGTFEGVINIAGQKLILELWLEKAASPMHALHLGFGIGSFIVPEISNPFLAELKTTEKPITGSNTTNMWNTTSMGITTMSPDTSTIAEYVKDSSVQWAYLIVSAISIAISLIFYGYQFCTDHQKPQDTYATTTETNEKGSIDMKSEKGIASVEDNKEDETTADSSNEGRSKVGYQVKKFVKLMDPATCAEGERFYSAQLFLLLFCHFFMATGAERIYGKFIRSYAIDKHNFNGDSATLLNTTFWISFSLGRFAGFITGRSISIRILIAIEAFGVLISSILLTIFARNSSTMLWVFTQPMAFFIAPLFPSGVAWGDYHLQFTGMAITFLLFGGGIGGMCHMWLIGYLYDNVSHDTFLYHSLGIGIALVLFVTMLTLRSWGKGNRFKENDPSENEAKVDYNESVVTKDNKGMDVDLKDENAFTNYPVKVE